MISKETKTFDVNGKTVAFNFDSFKKLFNAHAKKIGLKMGELEQLVADNIGVSQSSVHSWRNKCNGPGDLNLIRGIAEALEIKDWAVLTIEKKEEGQMEHYSELQIKSIKKIYDLIIDYLHKFKSTGGFTTSLWYKYANAGARDPEDEIFNYIQKKLSYISDELEKEYFYLHDTPIYDELDMFINGKEDDSLETGWNNKNSLWETFEGKISYAYRFECEGPSTEEDYEKALLIINGIIKSIVI